MGGRVAMLVTNMYFDFSPRIIFSSPITIIRFLIRTGNAFTQSPTSVPGLPYKANTIKQMHITYETTSLVFVCNGR